MRKMYILNNGEKVHNHPMPFSKRNSLVELAKGIANDLKWTKKETGDLTDTWLNNYDVKKYREYMREIWGFCADIFIDSEIAICDKCESAKFKNYIRKFKDSDYKFHFSFCDECIAKEKEFWGDTAEFEEVE